MKPPAVWRRCHGCSDIENRVKQIGDQFGVKRRDCKGFWATDALHPMAITSDNLCVLLQRRLGQEGHVQLKTLRWRRFTRVSASFRNLQEVARLKSTLSPCPWGRFLPESTPAFLPSSNWSQEPSSPGWPAQDSRRQPTSRYRIDDPLSFRGSWISNRQVSSVFKPSPTRGGLCGVERRADPSSNDGEKHGPASPVAANARETDNPPQLQCGWTALGPTRWNPRRKAPEGTRNRPSTGSFR